ncbi:hypothetical protein [Desertihabitans aurantiacus]|uniref:hypothetical protein n=1 Tax=Desertihabitans aurantiacus TaxID=2282477 RepID=UPI000DF8406D|nr:hypothetical protein [Desertihabitans aurantiacus]
MGIFDKIKDAVTGEGDETGPDTTTEQEVASTSTDNGRWGDDHVDGAAAPAGGTVGPGDATWGEQMPAPSSAEPGAEVSGSGMPAGDTGGAVPQDDTAAPAPDDRV